VERTEENRHPRFYYTGRGNDVTEISTRMMEIAELLGDSEVETRQVVQQNHVDDAIFITMKHTVTNDIREETYS
jgi:hypothetical protein